MDCPPRPPPSRRAHAVRRGGAHRCSCLCPGHKAPLDVERYRRGGRRRARTRPATCAAVLPRRNVDARSPGPSRLEDASLLLQPAVVRQWQDAPPGLRGAPPPPPASPRPVAQRAPLHQRGGVCEPVLSRLTDAGVRGAGIRGGG
eukprot:scaffold16457_cov109-Isochrysis_galbana.AAC.7